MLKEGDLIPEFSLIGDDGNTYTNETIKGKKNSNLFLSKK